MRDKPLILMVEDTLSLATIYREYLNLNFSCILLNTLTRAINH